MKLLFIGEGRHDIGDLSPNPYHPRAAQGMIPTLARRIIGDIEPESVTLAWTEISRFNPGSQKRGYPAKIKGAVLLATRKFGCVGTVVVADRDGKPAREVEMEAGTKEARQLFTSHAVVWGLAVESVEAWTLAVPEHIAEELGVDVNLVRQHYPSVHVESLSVRSGKADHRPKGILDRIAQMKHRTDSTEFRQAIAERTDVERLAQACPAGFGPFLERLRNAFTHGRI